MLIADLLPNAALVLTAVRYQTFIFTDAGKTYRFDINAAQEIVQMLPHELCTISLKEAGIDWEHIAARYPDIDWDYAATCDLSEPLLFVPWKGGACQLIDGWHRLLRLDTQNSIPASGGKHTEEYAWVNQPTGRRKAQGKVACW